LSHGNPGGEHKVLIRRAVMSTVKKVLFSVAALVIAAPGVASADAKQAYMEKCAVCHGTDGQGVGPFTEFLKQGAPNLTLLSKNNGGTFPTEKATGVITGEIKGHGTREMPVWSASMSDADVAAMVAYLEANQAK